MKVPRPWSARAWLDTAHVMIGFPVAVLLGGLTLLLAVAPPLLRRALPWFTRVQRSRLRAFQGVRIPPVPAPASWRDPLTWRQIGYHLLSPVVGLAGAFLVAFAWGGAVVGLLAFLPPKLQEPPLEFALDLRDNRVQLAFMLVGLALLVRHGRAGPVGGPYAARAQPYGAGAAHRDADREPGRRDRRGRRRAAQDRA
jgi:hypothetical protein